MCGHSEKHAEAVGDEGGTRRAIVHPESCALGRGRAQTLRGVIVLCALAVLQSVDGVKCFEGKVTYCGISNDGGAIAPPGLGMFVEGPGWACADDNSGLTPTTIAPNCWDQASCEALQTGNYDDPHNLSHSSPYDYVSEPTWTSRQLSGMNATECPPDEPACALQTTLREGTAECSECRFPSPPKQPRPPLSIMRLTLLKDPRAPPHSSRCVIPPRCWGSKSAALAPSRHNPAHATLLGYRPTFRVVTAYSIQGRYGLLNSR
ncbi:hypothetical protein T484DRAFT_2694861 [Baffinella frigidus]|nr:hypothetical protein T484DRAFT_2694861 [Cryptophyta sp. CCMP2293]